MHNFLYWFLIFFIYSVIGWIVETISCFVYHKKLTDRGFLIGPYCPIYGTAAVSMLWILTNYKDDIVVLFAMAMVIASIVEYMTSYIMEKIFNARWWDYSDKTFNVNGRICLINSLAFGFLGVLLLFYVNPFIRNIVVSLSDKSFYIVSIVFLFVFIADLITSFKITINLKKTIQHIRKDNTDEISRKVKETLAESSKLFNRILSAFPNFQFLNKKKRKSKK